MKLCNAPFCPNPKYIHADKTKGWCLFHLGERAKFKVKIYKEILPIWAVKRCDIHGLLRPSQAYLHQAKGKYLGYHCKKCTSGYMKERYDPNQAKIANAKKKNQKRNRELKCLYGITLDQFDSILAGQNNSCAICNSPRTNHKAHKFFSVDHCHTTNKVRGILCPSCNIGIGCFKDNIQLLQKAIQYLSLSNGATTRPNLSSGN